MRHLPETVFKRYFQSWWIPPLVGAILLVLLGGLQLIVSVAGHWLPKWFQAVLGYGSLAMLLLFLLSLAGISVAGIVHFCKKRFWRGAAVWASAVPLLLGFGAVLFFSFLSMLLDDTPDDFAVGLEQPKGVALSEPGTPLESPFGDWRNAPEGTFQRQVLTAIGGGKRLPDDAECVIPSLAKLSGTPEGRARLLRYLAASPDWRLYKEPSGLCATRVFRTPDGRPCPTLHNYYSHFRAWNTDMKTQNGTEQDHYQYRFGLGLDGTAWNDSRFRKYGPGAECKSGNGVGFLWRTRFRCGKILAEIFDESDFAGRQMTAKTLDLAEKEFAALLNSGKDGGLPPLPEGAARRGEPELILFNGFQGGLYTGEVWCNPGEPGEIFLKAYEITKGTRLSKNRLEAACNERPGWSGDPNEQFCARMNFTIYEGDWEQYYGARFEVWFRPDSGGPERKLFERNYRIQGWQR